VVKRAERVVLAPNRHWQLRKPAKKNFGIGKSKDKGPGSLKGHSEGLSLKDRGKKAVKSALSTEIAPHWRNKRAPG